MSLASGTRLGTYEVLALVGAGGMGEVYRARDTKLNRDVALKILPDAFAQDSERMARFEREAQMLASLNHPNIAAIHGLEESNGFRALVMELVEGPTLAERVGGQAIALDIALPIIKQIADALEYAHERGIVHRDLKPANIKIRPDGNVKVLDFGLAKLLPTSTSGDETQTLSEPWSQAGAIIGTPAYMSPEQARGITVDKRSDIWAFGAVLYEMLTGERTFQRKSIADTLAAVVKEEPDFTRVPAKIRGVVSRCLNKDRRRRWQDIGDVRIALEEDLVGPVSTRPLRSPWIILGVACAVAVVALALVFRPVKPGPKPLIRMNVDLGPDARLVNDRGRHVIAVSPDGIRIAFACEAQNGQLRICTRRLDQNQATALAGTEGVEKIFFSPDGKWIGFGALGKLKKISVEGGAPFVLCDAPFDRGAAWGDNGFVIAALLERTGLLRIPENGGTPEVLTRLKPGENTHRWPQVLPGGNAVLFTANTQPGDYESASVDVVLLKTGERRTLLRGGYYGRYLRSGHLVYMHRGTLFGARMDLDHLVVTSPSAPVLEDVASRAGDGGAAFEFSQSGMFIYESGGAQSDRTVQWLDHSGRLRPLISKPATYKDLRFSPDGKRLALVTDEGGNPDIWIYDVERGAMTRLTFGGANEGPVWSPGGQYLAYHSGRGLGIWWIRADGSGEPQRLTEARNMQSVTSFSGTHLAFEEVPPTADTDIWTIPLEGAYGGHPKAGKPEPFLRTPASEGMPVFSPDGAWLAYTSDESGSNEVFVRPFRQDASSQSARKTQISIQGGTSPIWSRNGHELFYTSSDRKIMAVPYSTKGDAFVSGKPVVWCDFQVMPPAPVLRLAPSNIDLAPDGNRFAVLVPVNDAPQKAPTHVNVLFNFFDELQRRVPAGK